MTKSEIKNTIINVLRNKKQQETNEILSLFISKLITTLIAYKEDEILPTIKKQKINNISVRNLFEILEQNQ